MPQTKHPHIAGDLRQKIVDGQLSGQLPGVNRLAADYAVNGRTMIKAIDALEEQGLVKRVPSKGTFVTPLRRERTRTLAAITGNIMAPLHSRIVHGMEEVAARHNHHLLFCGKESTQEEEARVVELLESRKADGFLVWPSDFSLESPGLRALRGSGTPFVVFPHVERERAEGVSWAICDDELGGLLATEHLIQLGHETIAFAQPQEMDDTVFVTGRWRGYCRALEAAGRPPGPRLRLSLDDPVDLRQFRRLSAVFCVVDALAAHVVESLRAKGVEVPGDISVVGYDNTPAAELMELTTVNQPMERIGAKAVEVLLEEIEGQRQAPRQIVMRPSLVVRSTTGKP